MGILDTFELFLDHPYGHVNVGSTLSGQVVLDSSDDLHVKEISVECRGRCHIELAGLWTSAPFTDIHLGSCIPLVVNDSYINERFKCFPSPESPRTSINSTTDTVLLPRGLNIFKFEFHIPNNTPASFEGERGYIRYCLRAFVRLYNKEETNVRSFRVLPVYDLNFLPDIDSPLEVEDDVEFTSFCFKKIGCCAGRLSLPKGGYVSGELLHVQVNINNDTTQDINCAELTLKMVTSYHLRYHHQRRERVLAVSKLSPVEAGYSFQGCDRNLRVPRYIWPSGTYGCRHIVVKYIVELHIKPGILNVNMLKLAATIQVGTIPLSPARMQFSSRMRQPPPSYEDLPPSYNDAILHLLTHQTQSTDDSDSNANDDNTGISPSLGSHCHSDGCWNRSVAAIATNSDTDNSGRLCNCTTNTTTSSLASTTTTITTTITAITTTITTTTTTTTTSSSSSNSDNNNTGGSNNNSNSKRSVSGCSDGNSGSSINNRRLHCDPASTVSSYDSSVELGALLVHESYAPGLTVLGRPRKMHTDCEVPTPPLCGATDITVRQVLPRYLQRRERTYQLLLRDKSRPSSAYFVCHCDLLTVVFLINFKGVILFMSSVVRESTSYQKPAGRFKSEATSLVSRLVHLLRKLSYSYFCRGKRNFAR